jgi:hypothetical protein
VSHTLDLSEAPGGGMRTFAARRKAKHIHLDGVHNHEQDFYKGVPVSKTNRECGC